MTFEKAFESIKKKFADADASGVSDFAIQITMSDEDCGGTFYAAVRDGVLSVEPYSYDDNPIYLDITKSDLLAVLAGRKTLDKAVDEGASLKGDASVIGTLKTLAKTAPKRPYNKKETAKPEAVKAEPAKKETAKKPAAKKTVKKETVKNEAAKTAKAAKTTKKTTK